MPIPGFAPLELCNTILGSFESKVWKTKYTSKKRLSALIFTFTVLHLVVSCVTILITRQTVAVYVFCTSFRKKAVTNFTPPHCICIIAACSIDSTGIQSFFAQSQHLRHRLRYLHLASFPLTLPSSLAEQFCPGC